MEEYLDARQREFGQRFRSFGRELSNTDGIENDRLGIFSTANWKACGSAGVLGLLIPKEYGGSGEDAVATLVALEALGLEHEDSGLLFGIAAQLLSVQLPLYSFGTEEQRMHYLPKLCSGELVGAHAMTELSSGSDAFALKSRARRTPRGYVLSGKKTYVTHGPHAGLFLVFAVTEPSAGFLGITCFAVPRESSGLSVSPPVEKMGLRTCPMGTVEFTDCEIDAACRLGPEGAGARIFQCAMEWERGLILAPQLGVMARLIKICVEYARQHKRFGGPIGNMQAVSHRIAEMKLRLETSRLLCHRFAYQKSQGKEASLQASMAKLFVGEAAVQTALDSIQILGGVGYLIESGLERTLRDSVAGRIYSGTSEVLRSVIARSLGLGT